MYLKRYMKHRQVTKLQRSFGDANSTFPLPGYLGYSESLQRPARNDFSKERLGSWFQKISVHHGRRGRMDIRIMALGVTDRILHITGDQEVGSHKGSRTFQKGPW